MSDTMFEVKFDDKKRKVFRERGIILNKLTTCFSGTEEYDAWMNVFTNPDNTTVDVVESEDGKIATFYTTVFPKGEKK